MSSTARDEDGISRAPCGTLRVRTQVSGAAQRQQRVSALSLRLSLVPTGSGAGARPRTAQRAALLGKQRAERWQHTL